MTGSIDYEHAHKHSSHHRDEIEESHSCGCFYCMAVFAPSDIDDWIDGDEDEGVTALCPKCGIDSVIGDRSGYPIKKEFLEAMNSVWFGVEKSA